MDPEPSTRKRRLRHPEHVHELHEDDEPGDRPEDSRIPVGRGGQQHQEREDEVKEENREPDPAPASLETPEIPGDFLGQVSGPDDQVL